MRGNVQAHCETERIPQHHPRGQGDIIKIEWPDGEVGPGLGLVINADCDLAHSKTDGVITFLPIYSFKDYLANFWAKSHIEEVISTATDCVMKISEDKDGSTLHEWLRSSSHQAVCESIAKYKSLKPNKVAQLGFELHRLAIALNGAQDAIERFRSICKANPDPAKYARIQITSAKKAMGDGHFFISDLVDQHSVGFVVRMRRVFTLPEHDLFVSESEQQSRSDGNRVTAIRIARLTELYRFKVLQLFAQQYSRIGLPDDVTMLSALAIDDLVDTFAGVHQ